jgi:hypothetical protein
MTLHDFEVALRKQVWMDDEMRWERSVLGQSNYMCSLAGGCSSGSSGCDVTSCRQSRGEFKKLDK